MDIVFDKGREYPSSTKEFPWIRRIMQEDAFTHVEEGRHYRDFLIEKWVPQFPQERRGMRHNWELSDN